MYHDNAFLFYQQLQNTPLHCAAKFGNADVVELILKSEEADICESIAVCNLQGDIPLHLAAESGSIETVEVLLKYSADEMIDKANDVCFICNIFYLLIVLCAVLISDSVKEIHLCILLVSQVMTKLWNCLWNLELIFSSEILYVPIHL